MHARRRDLGLLRVELVIGLAVLLWDRVEALHLDGAKRFARLRMRHFPAHQDIVSGIDHRKKHDHGLPHDPFKAIVAPRPIGWITSMSAAGEINLAPYSWFNGVSSRPPMVMFSSEERKDSLTFIEETKEFVCNFATYELREQVNQTSAPFPRGINEMEKCGLAPAPSRFVKPPLGLVKHA